MSDVPAIFGDATLGNDATGPELASAPSALTNQAITLDPAVQQMPSIAVDPLDADHVVVAFMDYGLLTSGYAESASRCRRTAD